MVDFVTALQAISAGLGVVKELSQVDKQFDAASLKLKVAELSGALATANITLSEAQTEIAKKDAELAKLRENFKQKSEMVEYDGFLYRKGHDGKPRGRAYCPSCIDKGTNMMTVEWGSSVRCPQCKTEYYANIFGFDL